ncbi:MAG: 3-hydroxyacyl-CoA dehydrogenase [Rhodoferax sp.]|nr:3-hydroxyacyl-CoA dehydrogenase [Rhodoferax sp.]
MSDLSGRHVVVTGAAQGIGAAVAMALAAQGASLTLVGRRVALLEDLAARLPGAARHAVVPVDVSDAEAVARGFEQARAALGPVTILVNNAGQAESAPFGKTSLALWQRMLDVNLTGTFLCTQAALPDMLAAGWGRIVNIASTAGQRGYPYVAAYVAAKHGVIGLTRALALEVAKKGITVNAVCPGYTETEILQASIANVVAKTGRSEAEARAEFARSNPQGRIVQPQEVSDAVAWLCSQGAGAVTGQSISVSGGEVM